jgi:O-6-methylguanine DNA methyltransferase
VPEFTLSVTKGSNNFETMKIYYGQYEFPIGKIFIAATEAGLFQIVLGEHELGLNFSGWSEKFGAEFINDQDRFEDLLVDLSGYFAGLPTDFNYPLDLRGATAFERSIWEKVRQIPYGQVRTYKWLASQVYNPKAFKAVGRVLGLNPLPIVIPCHRVIMHDMSLGGFAAGTGWKEKLLMQERGELRIL